MILALPINFIFNIKIKMTYRSSMSTFILNKQFLVDNTYQNL